MMGLLLLGAEDAAKAKRVREHAERTENIVHDGNFDARRSDDHTCLIGQPPLMSARCVFSVDVCAILSTATGRTGHAPCRHLTVTFSQFGQPVTVPWPFVEEVARLFGFVGTVKDWTLEAHPNNRHALAIWQPILDAGGVAP